MQTEPYQTNTDRNGNQYFTTDSGLRYYFLFRNITALIPMLGVYDILVSEFQFFPALHKKNPLLLIGTNGRIAITIGQIFQDFLQKSDRVVLYMCDSSDGKHKARHVLFGRWHRIMSNDITRIPIELSAELEDGVYTTYGSIMYSKDFEQKQLIKDFLIDKATEILDEKYT